MDDSIMEDSVFDDYSDAEEDFAPVPAPVSCLDLAWQRLANFSAFLRPTQTDSFQF